MSDDLIAIVSRLGLITPSPMLQLWLHLLWEQLGKVVTSTVTVLSDRLMIVISPHQSCHHNVQPAMRNQPGVLRTKLIDNEMTGGRSLQESDTPSRVIPPAWKLCIICN